MTALDTEIRERLDSVQANLAHIGRSDAKIVAVTKGFGPEVVRAAATAGLRDIGESYAQEIEKKRVALDEHAHVVHFIGRVQRNKVRKITNDIDLWQSVSRGEVIVEIAKRSQKRASILLQVRAEGDDTKAGVDESDIEKLLELAHEQQVTVAGLMTIGVLGERGRTRAAFDQVAKLADRYELPERSMGMSGDYLDALEAGSTMLRLGSALFGPRHP